MPRLSIIIPVFDVETYLSDCLDSIYTDTPDLSVFEVIVVNDGSNDGSPAIAENYRNKFENLTVVNQGNLGLSLARMNGLAKARGDYIWFVDSDDRVNPGAVYDIIQLIDEWEDIPVLMSPIRWHKRESEPGNDDFLIEKTRVMNGKEILKGQFPVWLAQRYVIRRSLFNDNRLYFPNNIIHEDEYFGSVLLMLTEKILVNNRPFYHYWIRSGSIMQSKSIRSSYDLLSVYTHLKAFSETIPEPDKTWFLSRSQKYLVESYLISEKIWDTPGFHRFKKEKASYIIAEFLKNARNYSFRELANLLFLVLAPNTFRKCFPKQ